MKALRPVVLLRKVVASSASLNCRNVRICNYSTIDSEPRRRWSFFSEDNEDESSVYKHALMFKRPSTINYNEKLCNSVSLIGTVDIPLQRIYKSGDAIGVYTFLNFKTSTHCSHYSKVLLKMWEKMAEMSINHLKPNDVIYIWGHLYSYEKNLENGNLKIFHEVDVEDINYVAQSAEVPAHQQIETKYFQSEDYLERKKKRLLLWQVFFANPYEWKDLRKIKKNPKAPDFKNKHTGEALWINYDDPPWIGRQLQFLDSVISRHDREGYMSSKLSSFL